MNLESLLKNSSIEDFTCNLCNNVLSYFPIYLTSDCQNVCGRCSPPLGNLHFRNNIYENLSQTVTFPCRYKNQGCLEELLPEDVPDHETCCQFRTIQCSLFKCNWEGARPEFLDHCRGKHGDMFLKDQESFEVDLSTSFHLTKLLENELHVLVSELKFDMENKKLQIAVYFPKHEIDVDKNYSCQLSLQNGTTEHLARFDTTSFEEISFTGLCSEFSRKLLKCYINFIGTSNNSEDKKRINSQLVSALKCSSCKKFALPPIYQCSIAKSALCLSCKKKHECKDYCTQDRNFALDKIANLLNYPCKHKERGCDFAGTPLEMGKHSEICQYEWVTCPFPSCAGWKRQRRYIEDHIQIQHGQFVHYEFSYTFKPGKFALKQGSRLFCVNFDVKNEQYCWNVQVLRGERDRIFEYQIELFHLHLPGKMLVRKPCKLTQLNKGTFDYDYVNIDQIGDNAKFKIKIV